MEVTTPRKKYLQRPKNPEYQHYLLRDVPKALIRKCKHKAKAEGVTLRWRIFLLIEEWADTEWARPLSHQQPRAFTESARAVEQSF